MPEDTTESYGGNYRDSGQVTMAHSTCKGPASCVNIIKPFVGGAGMFWVPWLLLITHSHSDAECYREEEITGRGVISPGIC